MAMFNARHYAAIAGVLASVPTVEDELIAEFVTLFRIDNPNFKSKLFVVEVRRRDRPPLATMQDHAAVKAFTEGK
jgi:hypothetical protein